MNEVDAMVCRLGNYIVKLETALKTANDAYGAAVAELDKIKADQAAATKAPSSDAGD